MTDVREPRLHPVTIAELRPTQMTVGLLEVKRKRKQWDDEQAQKQDTFLGSHMIPAVLGPKSRYYVIDHHHLCRALFDDGQEKVAVTVVANLAKLGKEAFWVYMDNRSWLHPYNAEGQRCSWEDLPKSIEDLKDDPYRSLAGALRRQGGYAKDTTPFSEFLWADFFRRRIKRRRLDNDFDNALAEALSMAKSLEADFLPGWCGPIAD